MKKKIWRRGWFWVLAVVLAIVLVVHFMLAIWVRDYVNRKLSEIPGYRGHVAAVTLHLWRGAYEIHKIEIKKTSGDVPVPFFSAPLVDEIGLARAFRYRGASMSPSPPSSQPCSTFSRTH